MSPNSLPHRLLFASVWILFTFISAYGFTAQTFDEQFEHWPVDIKIDGSIIAGEIETSDNAHELFLVGAGNKDAEIVVVQFGDVKTEPDSLRDSFESAKSFNKIEIESKVTDNEIQLLNDATGIWIRSNKSLTDAEMQLIAGMKQHLKQLIDRGGVLRTDYHITHLLGDSFVVPNSEFGQPPRIARGLNLVPDAMFYLNFDKSKPQCLECLFSALAKRPRSVGVGLEKGTTIALRQRIVNVLGDGTAHFVLAANTRKPHKVKTVVARPASGRIDPYKSRIDLTAWRRQAIERALPQFPSEKPPIPFVENGTLIIVGGGGMPDGLMQQMVDMAGGKNAKMIYVPCTERDNVPDENRTLAMWKEMGVASATVFHTKDRNRANSDKEFLRPLENATGIWFGGGRQWNFSDSYYGTRAHKLMKDVLNRGGVIGGSSAGASIQGRYLARANPLANFDIMADGYERGLGFLSGVAIDQHFSQRGRQKDMTSLVDRYPQLLGIGIDEATAIVVKKSIASVIGRGRVFFYDRNQPVFPELPDYTALKAGSKFDLAERKVIDQSKSDEKPQDIDNGK